MSRADFVIAVMSGDFTQRGEPALLDKWIRAQMAVDAGVDLVVELPFAFACNSAEFFARGGVNILEGLGCDFISFGSESGDADALMRVAGVLANEPADFRKALRKHLDLGLSFPKARELAVNETMGLTAGQLLKEPNNILAIEYLKASRSMMPLTVKRIGGYHDAEYAGEKTGAAADAPVKENDIVSATAIRRAAIEGNMDEVFRFMPAEAAGLMKVNAGSFADPAEKKLYAMICSEILRREAGDIGEIFGASEGIENKLKKEVHRCASLEELTDAAKSKRYTRAGIARLLIQILTGLTFIDENAVYARVLAMNEKGGEFIRQGKKTDKIKIPVITNINRGDMPQMLKYDVLAADMYNLAFGNDMYMRNDHVMKPYIKTDGEQSGNRSAR